MCCTGADASELGEVKTSKSFTVLLFFCVKSRKLKKISKWQNVSRTSLVSVVLKRLRAEKLPAFDECPDLSPYHQSSIKTYIHTKFQGDHLMLCGTLQACSFCRFHRWHLPINPSQVDLSLVSDLKRNFHIILHALMPDLQKILLDQLIVLEEPPCQVLLPARGVDDVWSCKTSAFCSWPQHL